MFEIKLWPFYGYVTFHFIGSLSVFRYHKIQLGHNFTFEGLNFGLELSTGYPSDPHVKQKARETGDKGHTRVNKMAGNKTEE